MTPTKMQTCKYSIYISTVQIWYLNSATNKQENLQINNCNCSIVCQHFKIESPNLEWIGAILTQLMVKRVDNGDIRESLGRVEIVDSLVEIGELINIWDKYNYKSKTNKFNDSRQIPSKFEIIDGKRELTVWT